MDDTTSKREGRSSFWGEDTRQASQPTTDPTQIRDVVPADEAPSPDARSDAREDAPAKPAGDAPLPSGQAKSAKKAQRKPRRAANGSADNASADVRPASPASNGGRMQIQKRGTRQIVRRRPSPKAIRPYSEGQQYKLRRRPMAMPSADSPTKPSASATPATAAAPAPTEGAVDEIPMSVEATAPESLDQTAPLQSESSAKLDQAKEVIAESASAVASVAGSVVSNIPDVARGAYDKAQEILPDENPLKGLHLRERIARLVKRISGLSLKRWQKITIACVAVLVVYVLGALLASFRMPAHAFVNGRDVSGMSKGAFVEQARGYADDYTLKVSGDGVNLDLHAKDIDLKYDADAFTQSALSKTSGWTWPIDLFLTHNWEVTDGITLDQARLDQAVSNAVTWANKTATFPKSASIAYDSKSGKFNGVKQEYGTAVNEDSAKAKTLAAASTLRRELQLGEEDILQPKVTLDDEKFSKVLEEANARSGIKLDLQIDGKRIAIVDPSLLTSWITVDENGNVVGDIDAITKWTRGDFSATIDTVGTTRTYTRPDGKQVTAEGGEYGWSVDGAQLATIIADRIAKISSDPIEVPFQSKGKVLAKGTPDWGKRFIDVDLSEQYVRMYDDDGNCIWESLCVSGDTGNGQGTITGVYAIEKKESPAMLVGLDYDGDGEPDYENEVNFWMPFYGGYGLHDATWRYSFGGDLFKYEGSHGCVNLPYDTAESLYSYVDKGDPVVVHW